MKFKDKVQRVSKTKVSFIASLSRKKIRERESLFVAEGRKCVFDMLEYFDLKYLIVRDSVEYDAGIMCRCKDIYVANETEMKAMSSLSTPSDIMAVFHIPERNVDEDMVRSGLTLVLDGVQDPGNLGTIVRVADWFGVRQIFASHDTADIFNPKTVQSTMGSLARVNVIYSDLDKVFERFNGIPVYGTLLSGRSIYNGELEDAAFIIMGNEGNGISDSIRKFITSPLLIPSYPPGVPTCESLNVGVATAITLSEFRRRQL